MNPSKEPAAVSGPAAEVIVLLVDDQVMVVEAIRRMLVNEPDIVFHSCQDPQEAMVTAIRIKPTIILQDLVMPAVDGMTLVKAYRENPATSEIPIVVLSSKEDPAIKQDAFARGATDYLVKLPDAIELKARIRAHSKGCLAQRALRETQRRLEETNAILQRQSIQDPLTGVSNRRYLDEILPKEWRRCARAGMPLGFILVDIDSFKTFNDHYGHPGGDRCLRRVAEFLQQSLKRAADVVARYGGEEFALVLPDTDAAGTAVMAERLRYGVEALALEHRFSPCASYVTISLGVAACLPTSHLTYDLLVEAADKALYIAKRSGRNRVAIADDPPAQAAA